MNLLRYCQIAIGVSFVVALAVVQVRLMALQARISTWELHTGGNTLDASARVLAAELQIHVVYDRVSVPREPSLRSKRSGQTLGSTDAEVTASINQAKANLLRFADGRKALLIVILFGLFLTLTPSIASLMALFAPLLYVFASIGLSPGCLACSGGIPYFDGLVSAFLGIMSILVSICSWSENATPKKLNVVVGACCSGQLSVQALLLALDPRLCAMCLTAAIAGLSVVSYLRLQSDGLIGHLALPPMARKYLQATLGGTLLLTAGSYAGIIKLKTEHHEYGNTLVGHRLSEFYSNPSSSLHKSALVMVTLNGCHVCATARSFLQSEHIEYFELPSCSVASKVGCFDLRDTPLFAPMLLNVNREGVITKEHQGWFSNAGEAHQFITAFETNE